MSFFKSFLGAAFAQSARDSKKRQEELDAWNKLFDEATDMSSEFSNYLTRLHGAICIRWPLCAMILPCKNI